MAEPPVFSRDFAELSNRAEQYLARARCAEDSHLAAVKEMNALRRLVRRAVADTGSLDELAAYIDDGTIVSAPGEAHAGAVAMNGEGPVVAPKATDATAPAPDSTVTWGWHPMIARPAGSLDNETLRAQLAAMVDYATTLAGWAQDLYESLPTPAHDRAGAGSGTGLPSAGEAAPAPAHDIAVGGCDFGNAPNARLAFIDLIDREWNASCAASDVRSAGEVVDTALADTLNASVLEGFLTAIGYRVGERAT